MLSQKLKEKPKFSNLAVKKDKLASLSLSLSLFCSIIMLYPLCVLCTGLQNHEKEEIRASLPMVDEGRGRRGRRDAFCNWKCALDRNRMEEKEMKAKIIFLDIYPIEGQTFVSKILRCVCVNFFFLRFLLNSYTQCAVNRSPKGTNSSLSRPDISCVSSGTYLKHTLTCTVSITMCNFTSLTVKIRLQ